MRFRRKFLHAAALLLFHSLLIPAVSPCASEYSIVSTPCDLRFPEDHGSHPGYRTEWWYYTGNLQDPSLGRFGFQLTFFRTRMTPPIVEESWPKNPSAWRTSQLFLAHAAVSDLGSRRFYHEEKVTRGAAGLAGVEQQNGLSAIFLGTWSANIGPEHRLSAKAPLFSFDLVCKPLKPPVLHGLQGYSLKGERPESASCYYSLTRLETRGTISVGKDFFSVHGLSWMDHEFSSAPLEKDLVGWDWFSIQLSDQTELMIYLLRHPDGSFSEASSGTFIKPNGESIHLTHEDFKVLILNYWTSRRSGANYPARWRVRVLPLELELTIDPNLTDQELMTTRSTQVTYWEGSVSVSGRTKGKMVEGAGYVEMTGYDKPFNLVPSP
jgi:predicted secreted hydrolase